MAFDTKGWVHSTVGPFNPRGRSKGGLLRVACIWFIMLFRTIHAIVYIARSAINLRTAALIVGCIFGALGTIIIIICLARIAAAEGRRRVLGINWSRLHFDIFLAFIALVSLALMIGAFLGGGGTRQAGLFSAWCIVWVIIALFTMIAQRPGTGEGTYV